VRVISKQYTDIPGILIAPSKGNLTRDIDPSTVAYVYGEPYQKGGFFPGSLASLREPYILRDVRGQALVVYPFQYDPLTHTLRVIHSMEVEIYSTGQPGYNTHTAPATSALSREFREVYRSHFLNYSDSKYTPLSDQGKMLVICHGPFMNDMMPLVEWKNQSGIPTQIVNVSTIGTTSTAIKNYISSYYATNGLTFVLLVGDAAQVPTMVLTSGHSDNAYGYISGNDHYPELFVGRFSAETAEDVQTQVRRTIAYERDANTSQTFFSNSIGVASNEGPGDDNEMDYQHVRNMQTDLLGYTYNGNLEYFEGSQGGNDAAGNPSAAQVATGINGGAGVILYTGHGSNTSWGTSGFSNANVNTLTNGGMLPFIWAVACVNGNFVGNTCFAEAWLRARDLEQPKGAVAALMSTINQSWNPPMEAQDEMVDILVESYASNIRRTFGGLSMNGCMKMNDSYGSGGDEMTDTWNLFGDPSLMVRTDTPMVLTASFQPNVLLGSSQLQVISPVNGALATLTLNGQIIASQPISGGMVTLNFPALTGLDTLVLVISGYNLIPLTSLIPVIPAVGPYVIHNQYVVSDPTGNQNGLADFGETLDLQVALTNLGVATAGQVSASLSTNDPLVTINTGLHSWGDIPAGDTTALQQAFNLSISNVIPDQHQVQFTLNAADSSGNTWASTLMMNVNAPALHLGDATLNDQAGGNGNGIAEPGETVVFTVPVHNNGHSDAQGSQLMLVSTNPLLMVDSLSKNLGTLGAGSGQYVTFSLQVDTALQLGSSIALHSGVQSGNYTANRVYYLTIGEVSEDFETGDFSRFAWSFGGNANWQTVQTLPYEGNYCARSGVIGHNAASHLEITLNVLAQDTLSFYRKVSSEDGYDFFSFWIDGDKKDEWAGEVPWGKVSYAVSPGLHTFKWEYAKDYMLASGSDCAWLDYITFPPVNMGSAPLSVTAVAVPSSYCEGGSAQLSSFVNGSAGAVTYSWAPASGLSDHALANPLATPASTTTYVLTVSDGASTSTASVTVTVYPAPAAPVIALQGQQLVSSTGGNLQWYNATGAITGANAQTYTPTASGDYYVILSSAEGCPSGPSNTITMVGAGLDDLQAASALSLWPNPARDYLRVAYALEGPAMVRLGLMDLLGQEVRLFRKSMLAPGRYSEQFDLQGLPAGLYLLRMDQGGKTLLQRVVVR
ncbi:MAG TPA: C25 family cysteine peptidase, partial [Bacteroidales bacterium]|nr:C25 family cysteine peptidase [Bacteroidales bacterium]